jgi:hypothetical protein
MWTGTPRDLDAERRDCRRFCVGQWSTTLFDRNFAILGYGRKGDRIGMIPAILYVLSNTGRSGNGATRTMPAKEWAFAPCASGGMAGGKSGEEEFVQ